MDELDLSRLRPLLDEEEAYANSIKPDDPRAAIAKQMLAIISDARESLRPSPDSTANYVPNKQIIEDLSVLRAEAERLTGKSNA